MKYTLKNVADYPYGPEGIVKSVAFPSTRFEKNSSMGRKWVRISDDPTTIKEFQNFPALLSEYPSGVEDVQTPLEEAKEYFETWGGLTTLALVSGKAKVHALTIIEAALAKPTAMSGW